MKGLEIPLRHGDLLIALDRFSSPLPGRQSHKRRHGDPFNGRGLGQEVLVCSTQLEIQALIDGHELANPQVSR